MEYKARTHTFEQENIFDGFFTIALQFTRQCNYQCLHCSEDERVPSMSESELYQVFDNIIEHGVKRVNISGGEPTLRKNWTNHVKYLSDKDISVSLATNCSTLTRNNLEEVAGSLSNLRVSIYGNEKTHDAITGRNGSYQKQIEATEIARELGIPTYACMAIMQMNLDAIEEAQDFCRQAGMEKLLIYSLVPKGRGRHIHHSEKVSHEEVKSRLEIISKRKPEIYWSPFDKDGICALIQADGSLVATPYFGDNTGVKLVGYAQEISLKDLWAKYPFKDNYLKFNKEKMKC
ncbi:MAG: radical SAM protein [Nanoarchaeota archaeon]|nr:radical SAM protein [Nanoarchaeota archaeon]MBU1977159.1 radical SAM protein [Nanoarchaeota archaeon]